MKKIFCFIIFALPIFGFTQTGFTFECNGYSFKVYEDDTPLEYSFKAGDRISRDYLRRVTRIGNINISYDYLGNVSRIGNVVISRDYLGRISRIGGLSFNYDYLGDFTGTSGRVGCNF